MDMVSNYYKHAKLNIIQLLLLNQDMYSDNFFILCPVTNKISVQYLFMDYYL